MLRKTILFVTLLLSLTTLYAAQDENIEHMFKDGKVSGNLRMMYASYEEKEQTTSDNYATAIGGVLKYELASLEGFNAAVALYTSHDITQFSGKDKKHNPELSSTNGSYTTVGQAYINYRYEAFNLRAGRHF